MSHVLQLYQDFVKINTLNHAGDNIQSKTRSNIMRNRFEEFGRLATHRYRKKVTFWR